MSETSPFRRTHPPPAYPDRAAWGTAPKLRAWQQEALDATSARSPQDFLAVATPGAGKTTFALRVATELLEAGTSTASPSWRPRTTSSGSGRTPPPGSGIAIDPNFKNADGRHGRDYIGVAVTYAQVARKPVLHRARTEAARTLVILDEIHHGGDALTWGDGIREAFEPAARRLALTGTPFRSDTAAIPFVAYAEDGDGIRRSRADYTYGYGTALRDHVVRPVIFLAYSGQMRWRTSAGDEIAAPLGEAAHQGHHRPGVADRAEPEGRVDPVRAGRGRPPADRGAPHRPRRRRPGHRHRPRRRPRLRRPAEAHHRRGAHGRALRRRQGLQQDRGVLRRRQRWMVAVRMVSEGVDVPRLAVGVYATSTSTPLFFAQAVGRFVRARKRGETASVFLPSVPQLMALANRWRPSATTRWTARTEEEATASSTRKRRCWRRPTARTRPPTASTKGKFEALESQASFDRVLFDGGEFGTGAEVGSEEELDFLGHPRPAGAEQVGTLLRQRQHEQLTARPARPQGAAPPASRGPAVVDHRRLKELRTQLAKNVSAWSARSGTPHGVVHTELRRVCGGPAVAQANEEQLQTRLKKLQDWFIGRK